MAGEPSWIDQVARMARTICGTPSAQSTNVLLAAICLKMNWMLSTIPITHRHRKAGIL